MKGVKLPVPLGISVEQLGCYEQLQQSIQLPKIIEVVYKCVPVVQILLFRFSFREVGCGKKAEK